MYHKIELQSLKGHSDRSDRKIGKSPTSLQNEYMNTSQIERSSYNNISNSK